MSLKEKELYEFEQFHLDVAEHFLVRSESGERIQLSEKAFETLCVLVRSAGHLVRKDELMNQIWADSFVEENNLDKCIFAIRRALGEKPGAQKFIETVRKHGYRFVAEVRRIEDEVITSTYEKSALYSEPQQISRQKFPHLVGQTEAPTPGAVIVALADWRRETDKNQPEESNGQAAKLELAPTNPIIKNNPKYRAFIAACLILAVVLAGFGYGLYRFVGVKNAPLIFQSIQASQLTDSGTATLAEISPDGRFVAFVNLQNGTQSLVVRQVVTGNVVPIVQPAPVFFWQPSFTSDGDFIYYVQTDNGVGTLFQIPTLGGESKKIIVDVDSKVAVSPDGKRIAFIRHDPNEGGDTIIIAGSDGANPEAFLWSKDINYDQFIGIDWSPENDKVLVGVFKNKGELDRKLQIATIGLKDKKLELVGEKGWFNVRNFEWMRSGGAIVLVGRANRGENSQVWYLSYPEGETRQITTDTNEYGSISISSDSGSMVATRIDTISSLWSRDPQTREMRQLLAENKNLLGISGISQMSDGKILLVKNSGKQVHIFSIDETGGGESQLTSGNYINQNPLATPDGKYIVFTSNRTGLFSIWRVNIDGSDPVQLTDGQTASDLQPQISKDGRNIIFMRRPNDGGKTKLMKVSIDGGDAVPLLPENTMDESFPRISPDGKLLAYNTFEFGTSSLNGIEFKVKVLGFDGEKIDKSVKEFVAKTSSENKFSPDNKSLTYLDSSGIDNIWSVSLSDRTEKPLTDFTSGNISNFAWSNDGRKLFIIRAVYNSDLVLIKDDAKGDGGNYE